RRHVRLRHVGHVDVVVHLAAVTGNGRPLSAHYPIVVFHDVEGVDAAVVLALAVDGRVAQRDGLHAVPGVVEAAERLADQLAAGVEGGAGLEGGEVGGG